MHVYSTSSNTQKGTISGTPDPTAKYQASDRSVRVGNSNTE